MMRSIPLVDSLKTQSVIVDSLKTQSVIGHVVLDDVMAKQMAACLAEGLKINVGAELQRVDGMEEMYTMSFEMEKTEPSSPLATWMASWLRHGDIKLVPEEYRSFDVNRVVANSIIHALEI